MLRIRVRVRAMGKLFVGLACNSATTPSVSASLSSPFASLSLTAESSPLFAPTGTVRVSSFCRTCVERMVEQ